MDRDQLLELVERLRDRISMQDAELAAQRTRFEERLANRRAAARLANKRADAAEDAMRSMVAQLQTMLAYKTPVILSHNPPTGAEAWALLDRWAERYKAVPEWSAKPDMQILLDTRDALARRAELVG